MGAYKTLLSSASAVTMDLIQRFVIICTTAARRIMPGDRRIDELTETCTTGVLLEEPSMAWQTHSRFRLQWRVPAPSSSFQAQLSGRTARNTSMERSVFESSQEASNDTLDREQTIQRCD